MTAVLRPAVDLVRGSLIGIVEVIPGVSGGTVALIVGVYTTLISSASSVVRGILALGDVFRGRGLARAAAHFRAVRWRIVLPVLLGMAIAVVAGAKLLAPLVADHPVETRAVFAGLIAASLLVPIRMVGSAWSWKLGLLALIAAVASFFLSGLPAGQMSEPHLVIVALAAAVAICALVFPGVSGSFLLLVFGLYETTLAAVNERNVPYLLAFAAGAVIGLASFVGLLRMLLDRHFAVTLAVATGLMAGSLRALWPWQTDAGALMPPAEDAPTMLLLGLAAAAVVLLLVAMQSRVTPASAKTRSSSETSV